ncbi:Outer membrane protein TolC [Trichlorobacter thiogenes]|uniref:Outer membrane protein TolC n=1 Tax=Trichlorobacter thiogenes TaxID=115783 RepID=A0A1T4Q414_9BACT|nr:TolC family protein [Trichlorobacter thiogenes]SJZ98404.1 Outer membrane protein TolC [Trichlorobacter thiogenes]
MTHCLAARLLCLLLLLLAPAITPAHAADPAMSLDDCIALTLRENRTIKNAYLDRVVQKYDLRMAEDKFIPTLTLAPSVTGSGNTKPLGGGINNSSSDTTLKPGAVATLTENLPAGGTLSVGSSYTVTSTQQAVPSRDYGWNVNLTQPLLKGAGLDVNLESVRIARINEQKNILALKSTLISTMSSVITSYRSYIQAIKSLEITRQSLERSRELVATNRELIAAGRMAAIEIVQSEADLANQELSLLTAENSLDAARLALTKAIDIDKNTRITPLAETQIPPVPYTLVQARQLAFSNRPDYQSLLLDYENSKRALTIAKRNTLWDLSLTGSYTETYNRATSITPVNSNGAWTAGLTLTIPLDNLYRSSSDRQAALAADIGLKKMENSLARQREDIEIEIQDALRSAEMNYRQIKLATLARTLSEKKVEIETEKLKAGRSTNFQLVSYQNDLKNAQRSELDAIITYQNALTSLESKLGITLERWGIALAERP